MWCCPGFVLPALRQSFTCLHRHLQKCAKVSCSFAGSKSPVITQLPNWPRNRMSLKRPSCTFLSTAIVSKNCSAVMPCIAMHQVLRRPIYYS